MTDASIMATCVSQYKAAWIGAASLLLAIVLACLISLFSFPVLVGIDARDVMPAVIFTASLVAIPILVALVTIIATVTMQRQELQVREDLFKTAQKIARLGYWTHDATAKRITLSDNVHDLLGDPAHRLHLTLPGLYRITHRDDRRHLSDMIRRIGQNGSCEHVELRIGALDGEERIFWLEGQSLLDKAGVMIKAYGACQDITTQKRTEAALRESEDHYRHAVDLSAQAPWTADPEGNILEAGPQWVQHTGLPRESALGQGWAAAVHPDDLAPALRVWQASLATGQPVDTEYRLRQCDDTYKWFRARAACRRDEDGRIIRWYGSLEDVHDRRLAHDALQESEEFARSILDSTPDCVKVLDLDGKIQYMNQPGFRNMEIECEASVLRKVWLHNWPEEMHGKIRDALDAARDGIPTQFCGYCPTAKGTCKWWDVRLSPMFDKQGRVSRLIAISRDMTEMKTAQDRTEEEKKKAETVAQQLEAVLSSTTDCVMTLDRDLKVTYINRMAQDLLPESRRIVGELIEGAFPEIEMSSFRKKLERALQSQRPEHFEEYVEAFNIWLELHVYPQPDSISIFFSDVSKRHMSQERLLYLAHHDTLTGLVNRSVLEEQLCRRLGTATRDRQVALLFLDLDEFKAVNDTYGHSVGDDLLCRVSGRLRDCVRDEDIVARFGGDEFAVVADVGNADQAILLAERLVDCVRASFEIADRTITIGASIGLVVAEQHLDAEEMLRNADIALYRAKAEGRNRHCMFEDRMGERFKERAYLKETLRDALERQELRVHFQPLIDLSSGRVSCCEALLRWHHPVLGPVSPGVFIPLAEEMGLITEIGEWVLKEACRVARTWPDEISVSVNLSPVQFAACSVEATIARILAGSGFPASRLQVEITESILLADSRKTLASLHALREMGIRVSMDDFGTGYSSLSYLRKFPFDKIKIDQAFVRDLDHTEACSEPKAILRAIVQLAQGLGIETTAEGVETEDQLSILRDIGCSEAQGFLYSKPLGADDVEAAISRINNLPTVPCARATPVPALH